MNIHIILREYGKAVYWYAKKTGDYEMRKVDATDFYKKAWSSLKEIEEQTLQELTKTSLTIKMLLFMCDVIKIAKYFQWESTTGRARAFEIIDPIHNGKYGSQNGIWVQVDDLMDELLPVKGLSKIG